MYERGKSGRSLNNKAINNRKGIICQGGMAEQEVTEA